MAQPFVRLLLAAGADPNGGHEGFGRQETPLHWAASSDDVDVAEALIDGGADIEAPAGSIAGGTPLDNAVGYGCWRVARLLVLRGARVDKLWHAAALGMLGRTEDLLRDASPEEINNAFWQACAGGQRRAAELVLAHGADLNWVPDYARQGDTLATLAGQRVIAQHHQRLVGRHPGQCQPEHHVAEGIQAPGRAAEEAVEDRDVALRESAGGQRHRRQRAASLTLDPAQDQPLKGERAPRLEAIGEGCQQDRQRGR
jgi:ankyrin repeat protein